MEDREMSYPKGSRKKIKPNKEYIPQGILYWDTITFTPMSHPIGLAHAMRCANYANVKMAELLAVQPMNNVTVDDLAIVFAVVDQMKKDREST